MMPKYLSNLIIFKKSFMSHLRSNNRIILSPPSVKTRLGDRAFEVDVPKLRNDLPHCIRITGDFTSLKQKLKEYLLNELINRKVFIFIFYLIFY